MTKRNPIRHARLLAILLAMALCTSCSGRSSTPSTPAPGIDQPLRIGEISITVNEAQTRHNYQTHYIMTHADPPYLFYEVIVTLEGIEEPERALEWGQGNLHLVYQGQAQELELARWILVGDQIEYRADEDFNYRYVYIYKVLEDTDHSEYRLQLPEGQTIETGAILKRAGTIADKPASERGPQPGAVEQGQDNLAGAPNATVGGGSRNQATATHTTVCGGELNIASAAYASIGGGRENLVEYFYATIGGGYANIASGRDSTIGGGSRNIASRHYATVGGGIQNKAENSNTTIAGGAYNQASEIYATVCGGTRNLADGYGAIVGGGSGNRASGDHATSSGGLDNQATGDYAAISGGYGNLAAGAFAAVPGGSQNQARGDYSIAAGNRALVSKEHPGAFVFADAAGQDFTSLAPNEFAVRASGGVRFVTAIEADGAPLAGVRLPAGGGSWESLSDRAAKTGLSPVDEDQVLENLLQLQINTWSYKSQDASIRHIGPMADDFQAAFGLGSDGHYISSVDADGVALAGIQGLYRRLEQKEAQLQAQQRQIEKLEQRLAALEGAQTRRTSTLSPIGAWIPCFFLVAIYLGNRFFKRAYIKN